MPPDQASSPQLKRHLLSRRHVLQSIGAHAAALPLLGWLDCSAASAADDYEPLNRFPRMVHEFFVRQVRESGERHLHKLNQLQTKADAEEYVRDAQTRIRQASEASRRIPPGAPVFPCPFAVLFEGVF